MVLNIAAGALAVLSLLLLLWQWLAARRFPLHRRKTPLSSTPGVCLLKPIADADPTTADSLRTWLAQECAGPVQILFGVGSEKNPATALVRSLIQEFPKADIQLVVCEPVLGANPKVSKLIRLEALARHDILVISDADVRVPPDLLAQLVLALSDPKTGLVNCLYRFANPANLAMRLESLAVNADFWSQVLQSRSLKPLDFALGAVMAVRRDVLREIGGFAMLRDCLADDYQLGHRIAGRGYQIELSTVVAECWSPAMSWAAVWKHQLRWARTIRVCQPLSYFFSILSNPTLWPAIWVLLSPAPLTVGFLGVSLITRITLVWRLQSMLGPPGPPAGSHRMAAAWLAPIKDILQALLWVLAFIGNTVEWRGRKLVLHTDGSVPAHTRAGTVDK